MTGYSENAGRNWFSPPFHSGPEGYKMCICVLSKDPFYSALSVYLMRGEHDAMLMWPFRGYITARLVNQINDESYSHMEVIFKFSKKLPISSCSRVTSGERAKSGCEQVYITSLFDYVKDDCIKFKVTNIVVKS